MAMTGRLNKGWIIGEKIDGFLALSRLPPQASSQEAHKHSWTALGFAFPGLPQVNLLTANPVLAQVQAKGEVAGA